MEHFLRLERQAAFSAQMEHTLPAVPRCWQPLV
jgi:hypothetical protein